MRTQVEASATTINHSAATASTGRRESSGSGTSSGPHEAQFYPKLAENAPAGTAGEAHKLTRGIRSRLIAPCAASWATPLRAPRLFPIGGRPTRPSLSSSIAGPTTRGIFEGPGIFLGHTRLAITGILRGHQPVANQTGRVHVVFNGEIYNHRELRRELEARGYRIEGESDSAILPHAYEEWGAAFVERLDGIFAIALWDSGERRLVLCRDRFGVKPLYYAHDGDGLCFGSELKAVAVARAAEPEVDPAALGDYLAFGYVPGPRTMLRGILRSRPPRY